MGALIIKARLGLTDEELVEQIKENPYLQLFIGLEAFQYSAPFDPSMMVYFRKRLPEAVVNGCNELIVRCGMKVSRSSDSEEPADDSGSGGGSAGTAGRPQPFSQKQLNQGALLIDVTCAPVEIRLLTDLSLLNGDEAFCEGVDREVTEILIDAMHPQAGNALATSRVHPRKGEAAIACSAQKEEAPYHQDPQDDQTAAWPHQAESG